MLSLEKIGKTLWSHCNWNKMVLKVHEEIVSAKSVFKTKLVQDFAFSNSSKIFKYLHSLRRNLSFPSIIKQDFELATTNLEKAAILNRYFHLVFTSSRFPSPSQMMISPNHPSSLTTHLLTWLKHMYCFSGCYEVHGYWWYLELLKFSATAFCEPLCYLFNLSLSQHVLPKEWLIHSINPIHKSGDKSVVSNYRPISLLCVVSKVVEKLIYSKIFVFVFNLISSAQSACSKYSSCLIQFTPLYIENKLQTNVIEIGF